MVFFGIIEGGIILDYVYVFSLIEIEVYWILIYYSYYDVLLLKLVDK